MGIRGSIAWPGVTYPQHLLATRTNGCRPDTALLFAMPQSDSPSVTGTLSFGFDTTTLTWTNALCDKFTMQITTGGHRQIFVIKDRRWRWSKMYITGAYNVRLPDGSIDSATQKTLFQLATLLFGKLGETADVSAVTSSEYPEVVWDQSNVADEIEALLEKRGYVVSLQFDNTVTVYAVGVGATLPADTDVVNVSISVDPPEKPEHLIAALDQTLVQSKLKCIPFGLDIDGRVRKTQDLSYSPGSGVTGFDGMDLESFSYLTDPLAQACAKMSVGLWYGIDSQADGTQNLNAGVDYVPGEITVSNIRQLLPLADELLETATNVFGVKQKNPAYVEGTFEDVSQQPPPDAGAGRNTPDFTRVSHRDWTLDGKLGLVKFYQPAFKWNGTARTFADVYVTCSYSISNPDNWVKDRELRAKDMGGYGDEVIELTELERTLICSYDTDGSTLLTITDNKATVDADADLFLDAAANKYTTNVGTILLYRGIRAFNPDGIALQIVWQCAAANSPVPFSTHVSQNAEVHPLLPTRAQRSLAREARRARSADTARKDRYERGKRRLGS